MSSDKGRKRQVQETAQSLRDADARRASEHIRTRKEEPPPMLYKYATPETARKILDSRKLRFSSPLRFNDPFDSQWDPGWSIQTDEARSCLGGTIERAIRDPSSWPAETPPARREILAGEATTLARMSADLQKSYISDVIEKIWASSRKAKETIVKRIEDIRRRSRVCCFCKDAGGILMWSHYAANHRGFVLGFSSERLESEIRRPLESVRYLDNLPVIIDPKRWARSAVFGLADQIFEGEERIWQLAKASIWSYEEEWRFALIEPRVPQRELPIIGYFRDIDFPGHALAELVIGCKTEDEDRAEIIRLAKKINPDLRLSVMERHPERFQLRRSIMP